MPRAQATEGLFLVWVCVVQTNPRPKACRPFGLCAVTGTARPIAAALPLRPCAPGVWAALACLQPSPVVLGHRLALGVTQVVTFGFEMFLEQLGQAEPDRNRLICCAHSLLGLQTHFTTGAKDAGKMRAEGKEYVVKDGDVMSFLLSS